MPTTHLAAQILQRSGSPASVHSQRGQASLGAGCALGQWVGEGEGLVLWPQSRLHVLLLGHARVRVIPICTPTDARRARAGRVIGWCSVGAHRRGRGELWHRDSTPAVMLLAKTATFADAAAVMWSEYLLGAPATAPPLEPMAHDSIARWAVVACTQPTAQPGYRRSDSG